MCLFRDTAVAHVLVFGNQFLCVQRCCDAREGISDRVLCVWDVGERTIRFCNDYASPVLVSAVMRT